MKKKLYLFATILFAVLSNVSVAITAKYMFDASYNMEETYINSEIKWISNRLGGEKWKISKGALYNSKLKIGDGSKKSAETNIMSEFKKTTDTACNIYMKHKNGYIMVTSTNVSNIGDMLDEEATMMISSGDVFSKKINTDDVKMYCLYQPIKNKNGETIGIISCGRDTSYLYKSMASLLSVFIPINVLMLAVAIFSLSRLANGWLKTIKGIVSYLNMIKHNKIPDKPLARSKNKELNEIVKGINELVSVMHKNEVLRNKSETDQLTGMGNRFKLERYFDDIYERCVDENKPFAIELVDVDFFKQFNDNYGHIEGDKCLKGIANILKKAAHQEGVYAIRYGGDEFIMMYEGHTKEEVLRYEKLIHNSIHKMAMPHEYSKVNNIVTITQGAYFCKNIEGKKLPDLLKKADEVLYHVKENSKDAFDIG